jgi:hypothetical protein
MFSYLLNPALAEEEGMTDVATAFGGLEPEG